MYFTGDDITNHESVVKALYKSYLVDNLAMEPWVTLLATWGGADVKMLEEAPVDNWNPNKPLIVFKRARCPKQFWADGVLHEWTLDADIVATEASGILRTDAQPQSSDIVLCNFMSYIHNHPNGRAAMEVLKLEESHCEPDAEAERDIERQNPHKVTFTTATLPS